MFRHTVNTVILVAVVKLQVFIFISQISDSGAHLKSYYILSIFCQLRILQALVISYFFQKISSIHENSSNFLRLTLQQFTSLSESDMRRKPFLMYATRRSENNRDFQIFLKKKRYVFSLFIY